MGFSLLVQIGTNMVNDYYDYIRGADTKDRLGPERLVASGKIAPKSMLIVSMSVFAIAFLIGLNLALYRGWELLAVGVLSIIFGYGYTGGPFPLAYKGLGDVFVILFFGLVATMGTFYVVTGTLSWTSLFLGLALGLLANNILVVNNYRDRDTDRAAGKLTLIARFGPSFGLRQYWIQLVVAFAAIGFYAMRIDSLWACLPLIVLPLGIRFAMLLGRTEGAALNGMLARSAAFVLLAGLLISVGALMSSTR